MGRTTRVLKLRGHSNDESDDGKHKTHTTQRHTTNGKAFACQLLPLAIDMTYIRKGTAAGAKAGLFAGIGTVLLFTPIAQNFGADFTDFAAKAKANLDIGFIGFVANALVLIIVSKFTKPLDSAHVSELSADMDRD